MCHAPWINATYICSDSRVRFLWQRFSRLNDDYSTTNPVSKGKNAFLIMCLMSDCTSAMVSNRILCCLSVWSVTGPWVKVHSHQRGEVVVCGLWFPPGHTGRGGNGIFVWIWFRGSGRRSSSGTREKLDTSCWPACTGISNRNRTLTPCGVAKSTNYAPMGLMLTGNQTYTASFRGLILPSLCCRLNDISVIIHCSIFIYRHDFFKSTASFSFFMWNA